MTEWERENWFLYVMGSSTGAGILFPILFVNLVNYLE